MYSVTPTRALAFLGIASEDVPERCSTLPVRLACGHTFCRICLETYLDTKLAQHVAAHPAFVHQLQELSHYRQVVRQQDNAAEIHPQLIGELAAMDAGLSRPQFNCPTCRSRVLSRPSREIALRHASELISTYRGDAEPEQGHGAQQMDGVWDRFFGVP